MDPKLYEILRSTLDYHEGIVDDASIDDALVELDKHEAIAIDFCHEALSEMSDRQFLCAIHDAACDSGNTCNRAIRLHMADHLRKVQDDMPGESDPFDEKTHDDKSRAADINATNVRIG